MDWSFVIFFFLFIPLATSLTSGKTPKSKLALKMEELFGADIRSLALFRIVISLLLMVDLAVRMSDLREHYSDDGVCPRSLAVHLNDKWFFSFHFLNGSTEAQAVLFIIQFILAICMLFGYRTRLATFLSWLFLLSLQHRNPVVNSAADGFFRLLLFWSMFLPMGACYSIDSALKSSGNDLPKRILSFGTSGFIAQVCFMYWFSVPQKLNNIEWQEGTAVFYALNIIHDVTAFGQKVAELPIQYLKLLSSSVLGFETFGPLLLFIPFFTTPIRIVALIGFCLLHIGFGSCIDVELFPYFALAALIPLLPSQLWDKLLAKLKTPDRVGLKICFDGQCGFCKKLVLILRTFLLVPETLIQPAQEDPKTHKIMEENNSWVIVDHQGNEYIKFKAFIKLCQTSPLIFPICPMLKLSLIESIGTKLYEAVAVRRQAGAKITSIFSYRPLNVIPSKAENIIAGFLLIYVFTWNMWMVNPRYEIPDKLKWIGALLNIDQKWTMFVATTVWHSGWPVFPGKLKDGTEIDLFTKTKGIRWKKPKLSSVTYKNLHSKRYIINILTEDHFKVNCPYYTKYLCREWNSRHKGKKQLEEVSLYFVLWSPQENFKFKETARLNRWKEYCIVKTDTPEKIINDLEKRFDTNEEITAELYLIAHHYLSNAKYIEAEALYKKAIELQEQTYGKNSPFIIEGLKVLYSIYSTLGNFKAADEINQRITSILSEQTPNKEFEEYTGEITGTK